MRWDAVVGNPPYNYPKVGGRSSGNVLWPDFVTRGIDYQSKQYLNLVHPAIWRKPTTEDSDVQLWNKLSPKIEYLNINDAEKGLEEFGANTKFDWYVWNREKDPNDKAMVNDINDKSWELNLSEWDFLPNSNYDLIDRLVGEDWHKKQKVIFDSSYHASRSFVTDQSDLAHCHKVVHSTAGGRNIKYSDRQDRGHFGVSKLIIGESGVGDPIIDMEGNFAMTQGAMGLHISSKNEGEKMLEALQSEKMEKVLIACQWSGFRLDPKMIQQLRQDWYLHI